MRDRERVATARADIAVAVVLATVGCLVGATYSPRGWGADPVAYALTVLIFMPFALRRRAPVLALALSNSALLVFVALGYSQINLNFWGPVLPLYSVAALSPPRVTAVCSATVAPVLLWAGLGLDMPWYIAVAEAVVIPATAWVLGNVARQVELRNRQLAVLIERLRIEQELRTERAVLDERVRIARELHDVVAHHMSVIAVQTGLAGYVFDEDPQTARTAVDAISATTREAMREMRRLLMLLHTDDEPDDTAASLAHLPELASRMRVTGMPVALDLTPASLERVPPGPQLCAYRVIQEAFTNVIKHAGLAPTTVVVRHEADRLLVRVTNEPGQPSVVAGPCAGHGLTSMRERAALYEGTLATYRRPDGGFVVELILPIKVDEQALCDISVSDE